MLTVELKNVKFFPTMSEETPCFQASVYIDGERIGEASNRGYGGMTDVHPNTAEQVVAKIAIAQGLAGADELIDNLFSEWEIKTELTKLLKNAWFSSMAKAKSLRPNPIQQQFLLKS